MGRVGVVLRVVELLHLLRFSRGGYAGGGRAQLGLPGRGQVFNLVVHHSPPNKPWNVKAIFIGHVLTYGIGDILVRLHLS